MKRVSAILFSLFLLLAFAPTAAFASAASVEAEVYSYLTNNMGFNTAVACGILANVEAESGFRTTAVGDGGAAYGLFQWNSRRQTFFNFCSSRGLDRTSVNAQMQFLEYELGTTEKSTMNYLQKVPNTAAGAYDAGYHFCTMFERPSNKYSKGEYRGNLAKNTYWEKYHDRPIPEPDDPTFTVDSRYPTPFECYPAATSGLITVYDRNLNAYSTSERNIAAGDRCKVEAVYTNGYCYVSYPTKNGTASAYAKLSSFIPSGVTPYSYSPSEKLNSYTRSDMNTAFGEVYTTDSCVVVGKSGSLLQLIYPVTGGYKMGWIKPSGIIPPNPDKRFPVPIIAYNYSANTRTEVYEKVETMGTRPDGSIWGQIFVDDRCTINAVSVSGNWVNVTYPVGNTTRTGYVYLDQFFPATNNIPDLYTTSVYVDTDAYRKADMATKLGEVYTTDTITVVGRSGNLYQVMYPVTIGNDAGKYKLAWIDGANLVKDLRGITVTSRPSKLTYLEGESLSTSGLKVTASYADGTTGDVTSACSISGYDSTPGTKTVTVTYQGMTSAFTVLVNSKTPTQLQIASLPAKLEYEIGEELDTTGLQAIATYDNGTTSDVTENLYFDADCYTTAGSMTVGIAYNYNGTTVTASFTVTVKQSVPSLAIVSHPNNVIDEIGSTATFNVVAVGSGLSYKWQWSRDNGATWTNSSSVTPGYNTATLSVPVTSARNGYLYRCVVSDAAGNVETSDYATLTATPKPVSITLQPVDFTGAVGSTATFTVQAVGTDLTYKWQYCAKGSQIWHDSSQSGCATATLSVPVTEKRDGQSYRCIVSDSNGTSIASHAATLSVGAAVKITVQPVNYVGALGSKATFTVAASGTGLTYQWQWSRDNGATWANSSSSFEGYRSASMKVPITEARNNYLYRCKVTDSSGATATSNAAKLTISVASVSITTQPSNFTGSLGTKAVFTVAASGANLAYRWQWSRDNGATWANSSSACPGYNTASMQVPITEARNGYLYRCIVTDGSGATATSNAAKLTVGVSTVTIVNQPSNYSGALGTKATFTVVASGTGLTYQWQWSRDNGQTWANSSSSFEGYRSASMQVPITEARNGYLYRCVVTDASGATVTSNAAKLTITAAPSVSITVQPEDFSGALGTTATFTVSASGSGLSYQWQYCAKGSSAWHDSSLEGCKTATLSVPVIAKRDGQSYRCVITDASGKSVTSNAATLSIEESVVLPADLAQFTGLTTNTNASGITCTSARYGTSELGRDLVAWVIYPANYTRTILLNFEIHGWEDSYAADGQILVNLGNALVEYYAQSESMNGCRLIIIPSCNPDGLTEGTTNNGFGRCNAQGVDLNRDFDVAYQSYSSARNYTPYAFSAKESSALRDLVLASNPEIAIDFHGWENCTIGDSEVAEVFSLYAGLNHKTEFTTNAHGYFAYWAESQGAKGLLVEFTSPYTVDTSNVIQAINALIANEYGVNQSDETDETFNAYTPLTTYTLQSGRVYTHQTIGGTETTYGYIDGASDKCQIVQIYANGWCKVRYPVSNYTKIGYCEFSNFLDTEHAVEPYQAAVSANQTVYSTVEGTTSLGSVWSTDVFTVVADAGEMIQIIYPLDAGGFKMGWIPKSALTIQSV